MTETTAKPREDNAQLTPEDRETIQQYMRSWLAKVEEEVTRVLPFRLPSFIFRHGRPPKDLLSPHRTTGPTLAWQIKISELLTDAARWEHSYKLPPLAERYVSPADRRDLKEDELPLVCDAYVARKIRSLPLAISREILRRADHSPEAIKPLPERCSREALRLMEEMELHRALMAYALSQWQGCSKALHELLLRAGLDSPQIDAIINDKALAVLTPADMGSRGGRATSARKVAAARANGRKGGRPKKKARATRRKNTKTQADRGYDGE